MRRLFVFLLLPAAALRVSAQMTEAAAREAPRIIMPGAPVGQSAGAPIILTPSAPTLSIAAPQALVMPEAHVILAPAPMIVPAARALTEAELAVEKLPSQDELKTMAESLAPARESGGPGAAVGDGARSLDSSFDGKLAPEASVWDDVAPEFTHGPLAPGLPTVGAAARSLIARLLPSFYRRVPVTAAYDRSDRPTTGHRWTPKTGHVLEFTLLSADARGDVPSVFGVPGRTRVQQKIESVLEYAHEYFHALFDHAVRRKELHSLYSVYSAMTEGFAVSGEQLLIKRLLDMAPLLGLGPRDTMDLSAVARARSEWLDLEDTHYSEGFISWRKAYERGGEAGLLRFLSSLSARRMIALPRADPAYQIALGEPALLSAYLGRDESSPARRGLEAFEKAARGEKLTEVETREASEAVDQAGAPGWRRLFERTLFADKRLKDFKPAPEKKNWYDKDVEPPVSYEPIFALARLSPSAGAELARFLAETISSKGGGARLFGTPGPNEKLIAISAGAEKLPWVEADRQAWNDGLMRWLTGAR